MFYEHQRAAAEAYLASLSKATADAALGNRPVDTAAFDALPRFQPPADPPVRWTPVIWLAAFAGALGACALIRLRRASPI